MGRVPAYISKLWVPSLALPKLGCRSHTAYIPATSKVEGREPGVHGHCPGPQSGPGVPGLCERLSKINHGKALDYFFFLLCLWVTQGQSACSASPKTEAWSLELTGRRRADSIGLSFDPHSAHTDIVHTETHSTDYDNNNNNNKRAQWFFKTAHEFEALPLHVCAYTHTTYVHS